MERRQLCVWTIWCDTFRCIMRWHTTDAENSEEIKSFWRENRKVRPGKRCSARENTDTSAAVADFLLPFFARVASDDLCLATHSHGTCIIVLQHIRHYLVVFSSFFCFVHCQLVWLNGAIVDFMKIFESSEFFCVGSANLAHKKMRSEVMLPYFCSCFSIKKMVRNFERDECDKLWVNRRTAAERRWKQTKDAPDGNEAAKQNQNKNANENIWKKKCKLFAREERMYIF